MSIKEFDNLFGPKNLETERKEFVNRIEVVVFDEYVKLDFADYKDIFYKVCFELGEDPVEQINKISYLEYKIPNLRKLGAKDFNKTLRVIVALYNSVSPGRQQYIDHHINDVLSRSGTSLGIKWKSGLFYPAGDELLDKELIEGSITRLEQFQQEKKDIQIALENYQAGKLHGVVENCYLAIEGIARKILTNNATLIDNKNALLACLNFSQEWKGILANYIKYANEYRRHATTNRHNLSSEEVESFLYLTCLLIRSLLKDV